MSNKVKVSAAAKALIESRCAEAPDHRWQLRIHWRKGDADNLRAPDGASVWVRKPDRGWGVGLTNWPRWPDGVPDFGEALLPGVRLLVTAPGDRIFPGGEIVVEEGKLKLIVDAT